MKILNFEFETSNLRCLIVALFLMMRNDSAAQIQQAWVAHYNNGITNGTNQAVKMALDGTGNIYITGFSQNTNTNLGYVTVKYAPNGNQLWVARFDSTNYPAATPSGLVLDTSNNVFVTGSSGTVKYDMDGSQLWTAPYSGVSIAMDPGGNVIVTGMASSFSTAKLNSTGSNLWQTTFTDSIGPALSQSVLADSASNVYVIGSETYFCHESLCYEELLILKYDQNGNELWTAAYNAGGVPSVHVGGTAIDTSNNLYVVTTFEGFAQVYETLKYANDGTEVWNVSPNNNGNSEAMGLALDHVGNVLVTGMAKYFSFYFQYGTFGINSNGSPVWTNYYPQPPAGVNAATSIAVDSANNSYVTGYSSGVNGTNNIVTIKYSPNGDQVWLQQYNGLNSGNDAGKAIALDKNGNVYVTGYETLPGGGTGIVTIKYIPLSIQHQTNGTVSIEATGSPGEMFDIEASTNLQTWLDLGTVTADTNGLMQFDDTNAPSFPARFYYTNPQ